MKRTMICPKCLGKGKDKNGIQCEKCKGSGRIQGADGEPG